MARELALSKKSVLGPAPCEDKGSRPVGVLCTAPPQPGKAAGSASCSPANQAQANVHPDFLISYYFQSLLSVIK